jgi:hypothetical protein
LPRCHASRGHCLHHSQLHVYRREQSATSGSHCTACAKGRLASEHHPSAPQPAFGAPVVRPSCTAPTAPLLSPLAAQLKGPRLTAANTQATGRTVQHTSRLGVSLGVSLPAWVALLLHTDCARLFPALYLAFTCGHVPVCEPAAVHAHADMHTAHGEACSVAAPGRVLPAAGTCQSADSSRPDVAL